MTVNTLKYAKALEDAGENPELAEIHATAMHEALDIEHKAFLRTLVENLLLEFEKRLGQKFAEIDIKFAAIDRRFVRLEVMTALVIGGVFIPLIQKWVGG